MAVTQSTRPFARAAAPGTSWWYSGCLVTSLAEADETAGQISVVDVVIRKGMEPPPHTHTRGRGVLRHRRPSHLPGRRRDHRWPTRRLRLAAPRRPARLDTQHGRCPGADLHDPRWVSRGDVPAFQRAGASLGAAPGAGRSPHRGDDRPRPRAWRRVSPIGARLRRSPSHETHSRATGRRSSPLLSSSPLSPDTICLWGNSSPTRTIPSSAPARQRLTVNGFRFSPPGSHHGSPLPSRRAGYPLSGRRLGVRASGGKIAVIIRKPV